MYYLKPPKRFPVPEDMCNEETATWINWIHLEMQALLEDLNEEIRLQNEEDDPFTKGIVYTPTGAIQEPKNITISQESSIKNRFGGEISPQTQEQHEDKLTFPLPVDKTSNLLPQHTTNRYTRWQAEEMSEILPVNTDNRELRSKPPVYIAKTSNTRQQINYDNMNWDGNNTSYLQLPDGRHQGLLEQFSIKRYHRH